MGALALVMLGAALGGGLRHGVNLLALRTVGTGFPWGTLAVNVLGSTVMGLVVGLLAGREGGSSAALRLFLATGLLGGFTTFSAFSLETVLLWQRGEAAAALGYVAGSVVLAVAGLLGGLALARIAG